jgi:hypothetical protein
MVIAALLSFGILFVAWLLAPDRPRTAAPAAAPEAELQPLLGAA